MTDAAAPANSEQSNPRGFSLAHQYVKDLSFENPHASEIVKHRGVAPKFNVDVNTNNRELGGGAYEVDLVLNATATINDTQAFIVECVYSGVVVLGSEIVGNAQLLETALVVETPRLLFPFARQIVADATSSGGYPPLMLHPINFSALLAQKKAAQTGEVKPEVLN